MFWVYVLQNSAGTFYIGHTEDLHSRVQYLGPSSTASINPDECGNGQVSIVLSATTCRPGAA
jgi:hypothetical protein